VCDSAATRPSSQITLGRLVVLVVCAVFVCCQFGVIKNKDETSVTSKKYNIFIDTDDNTYIYIANIGSVITSAEQPQQQ